VDQLPFTLEQIQFYILIFVRISAIVALLPIFGSQMIPYQLKVGLSLLLSVILFSSIMSTHPQIPQTLSIGLLILLIVKEVMVGLAIGFAASFIFTAVQFAGRLIDTEIGFGFVELVDPFTDEMVTVFGQLQVMIFTIIFLLFNGHYFLLLAIQKSFEIIPLMGMHIAGGPVSQHITTMITNVFILAIKFSAPIYVTLILTEMALGVVARTAPQINIFFVGMPLKIVIGLLAAIIVFPTLATLFRSMIEALIQDIWRLLYLMA